VGDPNVTGKTPGTDLKEGVFTLPVLLACERDPAMIEELQPGRRDLERVLQLLGSTGALEATQAHARGYADSAREALANLPDSEWKTVLLTISEGVLAQVK
jgi:geranylgeranyl pyrophosphate synthase